MATDSCVRTFCLLPRTWYLPTGISWNAVCFVRVMSNWCCAAFSRNIVHACQDVAKFRFPCRTEVRKPAVLQLDTPDVRDLEREFKMPSDWGMARQSLFDMQYSTLFLKTLSYYLQ